MERPIMTADQAVKQAGETLKKYASQARDVRRNHCIADDTGLFAQLIKTQADDFNTAAICSALHRLADAIESLKPEEKP